MKETFFQLSLLNLTPGISTHFSIKWKFKSYPWHSTNEDHVKENRKRGIIIIQWKNFSNMDRKIHKPEIRPQKMLFFFFFIQQGTVFGTRLQGRSRWDLCPFWTKFSELLLGLHSSNGCIWAMAAVTQDQKPLALSAQDSSWSVQWGKCGLYSLFCCRG